ncbi:hypothetical protein E4T56_gene14539 [Termitomyces sp. T112]|nr:hypothetical protein E4T56_gene14539 [Termitomyces sp. T112]
MNKSLLNQVLPKKPVTITSTDFEGDEVLVDSKHCQLSPPDASEDPVGSGNSYKEGQENDESGSKSREKNTQGKARVKLVKSTKTFLTSNTKQTVPTNSAHGGAVAVPPNIKSKPITATVKAATQPAAPAQPAAPV